MITSSLLRLEALLAVRRSERAQLGGRHRPADGGFRKRRLGVRPARNLLRDLPVDPCLLYTSPSPRDRQKSRMPSSA